MDRRRATRHHPHHHRGKQRHLPSHTHNRTRHLHIRQRTRGNPNQTLLPWITTTPHIIYWGDIDADGLEILSELRQTGITCDSILMDSTAYKTYDHTAPNSTPKNNPSKHADPKPTPGLTQHERNLYEQLCTGKNTTYLRIEQERIPINDAMTILHNQHQWNTTHHK